MRRGNSHTALEARLKAKGLNTLKYYAGSSIVPFCDDRGQCWLLIKDTMKKITKEDYFLLKEIGL